jgi:hypothetical protein
MIVEKLMHITTLDMQDPWQKAASLQLIESNILQTRREWQQQLLDLIQSKSARGRVHIVVGVNVGKTIFTEYLEHMDIARRIPPVSTPSDVMGWCMSRGPADCYVFDYPYAIQKMHSRFWESISSLKDGYLFARMKGKVKEMHIEPPVVIIFVGPRTDMRNLRSKSFQILGIDKDSMRLEKYRGYVELCIEEDKKWGI